MATLQVPGVEEAESSDEEYFDAKETDSAPSDLPEVNHLSLAPASPKVVSPSISNISISALEGDPPEIEEDKDFHEKADFEDTLSSNRNIVLQLLSQIRIGMDLTRFVLPVFLFEKRSLLELYAEFFSHPDIILNAADLQDPRDRMVEIVKWFLSSLSASRKAGVPQKPYNPVLGEVFSCYWDVPNSKRTAPNPSEQALLESGPKTFAGYESLSFLAEQVSHHPPISAMYIECPAKRVAFYGSVETKLKFQLGLSVKIQNHGKFELHLLDYDEVYTGSFPNGYVRSVLTTPWLEFGGECAINCSKSGYNAKIDFHSKPFRGGQKHRISTAIRHVSENKPFMKLEGNWNSVIYKKISKDRSEVFLDVHKMPCIRKKVRKFSLRDDNDSRMVWRHVTEALEREDAEAAVAAKHEVEEAQRQKVRDRRHEGTEWVPKHFREEVDGKETMWVYRNTLKNRIAQQQARHNGST